MTAIRTALVVGGGPAGLVAAANLAKRGVRVELVERNDNLRPLGSGLSMAGATLRALRSVDEEAVRACLAEGAAHDTTTICDASGSVLQAFDVPRLAGSDTPGGMGIMRPVFWGILADMAQRAGVAIQLATTVERMEQDGEGVDVLRTDGRAARYELVVGADGLHSKVRSLAFPDAPAPRYNGQTVWRAVVERPTDASDGFAMYYGTSCKAGYNPVSREEAYIFVVENALRRPRPPQEQWPELVRQQLEEFGGLIGRARDQLHDPQRVDCHPPQVFLLDPPWHRGRVVLIGDAAHATTPHLAMGAGIAIEDGVVLGEELSRHGELSEALEAFTARRYERCRLVVESSAQLGAWEQDPTVPASEHARLASETSAALALPI